MLRRYKYKLTGPYNEHEIRDVYSVSVFLHNKVISGDNTLNVLEKDYISYCRKIFVEYTKYPLFVGSVAFLFSDWIYPINTWKFIPRIGLKFTLFYFISKTGLDAAYEKILEFPMLDEVIAGGVIKFTEWVELSNPE